MHGNIAKFISEMGVMKLSKRTGWWLEGVKDPDSLAEHTFRAVVIGYILAKMEKADENKVVKMLLFHDIAEIRTNDPHAITRRYIKNLDEIESAVLEEQVSRLPEEMAGEIKRLSEEFNEMKTKESLVAKDADTLELLATAKENVDTGYKGMEYWLEQNSPRLRTEAAKKLFEELKRTDVGEWRRGLEKIHHLHD